MTTANGVNIDAPSYDAPCAVPLDTPNDILGSDIVLVSLGKEVAYREYIASCGVRDVYRPETQ